MSRLNHTINLMLHNLILHPMYAIEQNRTDIKSKNMLVSQRNNLNRNSDVASN